MKNNHSLVEALGKSQVYQQYQRAFTETTGLPLTLRPVESWQLPFRGKKNESPFCALMAGKSRSCAGCLQIQQKLVDNATSQPYTTGCGAGLWETAVPVRSGDQLIGFLQTGQVFQNQPTAARFDRTAKLVSDQQLDIDVPELKEAYFSTRVMPANQYAATVHLLTIFAEHLAMVGTQMMVHETTAESPIVARAKRFINDNYREDLSLQQVAKAANMSMFYFCKVFKRSTGTNFTEYLSMVRIEKAKNLLLNRDLHISEIGYEVGFQSLTHFNRVFKKIVGRSPTEYRNQLPSG